MKPHDWMSPKGKGKRNPRNEEIRENEETQQADMPREPEERGRSWDELSTIMEIRGDIFDPIERLSVLALVDIDPEVKKRRPVPEFFHIKKPATILGTARKAQVKVDDLRTVRPEHAVVVFREGRFRIYPLMGEIRVDGDSVSKDGEALSHGSTIQMGSAELVFLTTWIPEDLDSTTQVMEDDDPNTWLMT